MKNVTRGGWMARLAGRAAGLRSDRSDPTRTPARANALEQLENRVLLSALDDFPVSTAVPLAGGMGTATAMLDAGDDILYNFVLTGDTWIGIEADALAGGIDTRIELYRDSPMQPGTPMPVTDGQNNILASSDDGALTGVGLITDAFIGSVLPAGTYFVLVSAENGTAGTFQLELDTTTVAGPTIATGTGSGSSLNQAAPALGEDIVYAVTIPSGAAFDDVLTAYLDAPTSTFDGRLDLIRGDGSYVQGDSEAGQDNDPFVFAKSAENEQFFIRVRSDEIVGSNATGNFNLLLEARSDVVNLDPVTRIGTATTSVGGSNIAKYRFSPQTDGLTYVEAIAQGFPPPANSALRMLDTAGNLVAFSDDVAGINPQILISLDADETYFLILDAFPSNPNQIGLQIEAGAVFDLANNTDDHANFSLENLRDATPIAFGNYTPQSRSIFGAGPANDLVGRITGTATGRIEQGGDSDIFVFVPPVDMLGDFDGIIQPTSDPAFYVPSLRPMPTAEILLNDTNMVGQSGIAPPGVTFVNGAITVYDSFGTQIYPVGGGSNDSVLAGPGFAPDPAGALDESRWPARLPFGSGPPQYAGTGETYNPAHRLNLWGGETYYIEVTGGGIGRYNLEVSVDGIPDPALPGSFAGDFIADPFANASLATAGFDNATWIGVTSTAGGPTPTDFGDAPLFTRGALPSFDFNTDGTINGVLDGSGGNERTWLGTGGFDPTAVFTSVPNPIYPTGGPTLGIPISVPAIGGIVGNGGFVVLHESTVGGIEHPNDAEMIAFRAQFSGTVEARVQTRGIQDSFQEIIVDDREFATWDLTGDRPEPTITANDAQTRTYNSSFDSALRVFDSDFAEIGFSDENVTIPGDTATQEFGTFGEIEYRREDARIVFDVVQGEVYYIQVESAERADWLAHLANPTVPVAWDQLLGSYRLLVDTPNNPTGSLLIDADDYADADAGGFLGFGFLAGSGTELAADLSVGGTGDAVANGLIQNTTDNTFDSDTFTYRAATDGTVTVTITPTEGTALNPVLATINPDTGGLLLFGTPADPLDPTGAQTVSVSLVKGEVLAFVVAGGLTSVGSTEGAYTVSVDGPGAADDHADFGDWNAATDITISDHLGTGSIEASINDLGDDDLFRFIPVGNDPFSITVTDLASLVNAELTVFETTIAPDGAIVTRPVAFADFNPALPNPEERSVIVNVNPGLDRTRGPDTYRYYYLLVEGGDDVAAVGNYRVNITFPATDDHADDQQFTDATGVTFDPMTGAASASGQIELAGDSDFFTFTPDASGSVTLTATGETGFNPRLRLYAGSTSSTPIATQDSGTTTTILNIALSRGTTYFLTVDAGTGSAAAGSFDLNFAATPGDDHANAGSFEFASVVALDPITGDAEVGSLTEGEGGNPILGTEADTDLFTFTTLEDGSVVISLTPLGASGFAPTLSFFDGSRMLVGTATATAGNAATFTAVGLTAGQQFFVLVEGVGTGEYQLAFDGPTPGGSGGGGGGTGGPAMVDFSNPETPTVNNTTGDIEVNGTIPMPGNRVLYTFTVPDSPGRERMTQVFLKVFRADGSDLDAQVSVFNAANELPTSLVAVDADGVPGAQASLEFSASPGQQFWVIVDGIDASTGDFVLRIDAEPPEFFLYYPEGFAGAAIREFVSIANPNDYEVTYDIRVEYEGNLPGVTVVTGATIAAGARGGVTLSDGEGSFLEGLTEGTPYAIIVESDGPLAGTLARYDFSSAVGDAMTGETSTTWTFARVERDPGSVFDFLVFFNPNSFAVDVTLTVADNAGAPQTIDIQTVEGNRRGGWNVDQLLSLPTGIFGATLTAQAADPSNAAAFDGIVAALTHFDSSAGAGFGVLGDGLAGSTRGAITSLSTGDGVEGQISIYNPGTTDATVNLTGEYLRLNIPDFFRSVSVPAGQTVTLTGEGIGIVSRQPVGIAYTSDQPVSVVAVENQLGEANANAGINRANESWFFGDAFINAALAGESYFETLAFHNPTAVDTTITVELLFTNSDTATLTINVAAGGFGEIVLHEAPEILDREDPLSFFSIVATAPVPVAATLTHYDLFLQGGWGNAGSNIGIVTPFTLI